MAEEALHKKLSKPSQTAGNGECRGAKRLCRGYGGVPLTPFLARKGVRGMVESDVGYK